MADASEIVRELADVDDQLRALSDDAFAEKYKLLKTNFVRVRRSSPSMPTRNALRKCSCPSCQDFGLSWHNWTVRRLTL